MRKVAISTLIAAQILAAQPALAADLANSQTHDSGFFAGFRVRLALDGEAGRQPVRAGLALAPTLRSQSSSGEVRTRFGEGLELGISGREPLRLSIGSCWMPSIDRTSAWSRHAAPNCPSSC